MVEVVWTKLAIEQLERAAKYIQSEQGTFYAKLVLNKILEASSKLIDYPQLGPIEPLLKHKKMNTAFW